jgi:hypothetical protein
VQAQDFREGRQALRLSGVVGRRRLIVCPGDIAKARASLGTILEITRDAELRQRVTDTLNALAAA